MPRVFRIILSEFVAVTVGFYTDYRLTDISKVLLANEKRPQPTEPRRSEITSANKVNNPGAGSSLAVG